MKNSTRRPDSEQIKRNERNAEKYSQNTALSKLQNAQQKIKNA
ncbi:hypothetical protein C4K29_3845 [Pseudomonas chlororaphis subsp. piscium]|nr:hypothetical protein C4K29_3845 [Pseudomonas chlororaphis subsp. piscium]